MRNRNIEYLRAISCIMIILLHLNAWCFNISDLYGFTKYAYATINVIVRFAVPCFMMITGAFVFSNFERKGWKSFYRNVLFKVIIPTFCYSLLYFCYGVFKGLLQKRLFSQSFMISEFLLDWVQGKPFGHMWYMYMLIGFYLFLPILMFIRTKINRYCWGVLGFLAILLSCLVNCDNLLSPIWPLCWIQYVGYFIIADFIGGGIERNRESSIVCLVC